MTSFSLKKASKEQLPETIALYISQVIRQRLASQAQCHLALSGGNSPKLMLEELATYKQLWNKVHLQLVDERWTQCKDDQNQSLIHHFLSLVAPEQPVFFPLLNTENFSSNLQYCNQWAAKQPNSLDIIVLGMGLDGHTASLFPEAKEYHDAMNTAQRYVEITPAEAPYRRISMSYSWIKQASHILLFIPGADKLHCFESIINDPNSPSPIAKLMAEVGEKVTVFSSEDQS